MGSFKKIFTTGYNINISLTMLYLNSIFNVALCGKKTMYTQYYGNIPYLLCSIYGKGTFDF